MTDARSAVERAVAMYPDAMIAAERVGIPRFAFHLELVQKYAAPGGSVLDVGGGIGAFAPAVALAGYRMTLVDDFGDPVNARHTVNSLSALTVDGLELVNVDASSEAFAPAADSYDVVTSFDSIEHWHRSPKASLYKMKAALKPGGTMILAMPNCVDLYKRITVPFGKGKWSSMQEWYEQPQFRSHVREPDLDDMHYIARDLGLENVEVFGRNWNALRMTNRYIRSVAQMADRALRLFPSLCLDLYLVGRRPRS